MLRSISVSFLFTLLGKLVAFLRIQQMASSYPNSYWLDAFFLSFSITTFFETVLISGAIATAFIPKYISKKDNHEKELYFRDIYLILIFIFALLSLLIFSFAGPIASLLVSGNNPILENNTESLLMFFSMLPVASILFQLPTQGNQINQKFAISTLNPIILNGLQLAGIYFLVGISVSDQMAVSSLVSIYILSMLICYLFQRCYFKSSYTLFKSWSWLRIAPTFMAIIPLIAFMSIEEINILVDQYFASGIAEGGVSNLMYANRLVKIFGAIFVAAILTVFYPKVSLLVSEGSFSSANLITNKIMLAIILFSLPIAILFSFKGIEVAQIVYGERLSKSIGEILRGYSFMVVFSSVYILLLRVLFSLDKARFITLFGMFLLLLNYALNSILIKVFGLQGVALSSALISFFQCLVLLIILDKKGFKLVDKFSVILVLLHVAISVFSLMLSWKITDSFGLFLVIFFFMYYTLSLLFSRRFYIELVGLK